MSVCKQRFYRMYGRVKDPQLSSASFYPKTTWDGPSLSSNWRFTCLFKCPKNKSRTKFKLCKGEPRSVCPSNHLQKLHISTVLGKQWSTAQSTRDGKAFPSFNWWKFKAVSVIHLLCESICLCVLVLICECVDLPWHAADEATQIADGVLVKMADSTHPTVSI